MAPTYAPTHTDEVVCVSRSGNLYDVLELILDRGMVIDVFLRVSLVGIEILKVDARIVVASVDTYLRFAEACNRLDLEFDRSSTTVPELLGSGPAASLGRKAAKKTAKKAVESVGGKVRRAVTGHDGADEDEAEERESEREEDEHGDGERRPVKRPARARRRIEDEREDREG
ncbi:gas vesicle protein GvpJ [Streptomyces sparsogenes]|uniref:Gas vesicle protein A n=1 Tax=Streptomyces sparsogenes DSM 40356 TaxID=1331668 RepID=A0A1R1SNI1_9ACTN|nr:gas vesicle protein GvpJ [Streptomyces sparsogenes]OMI39782.1 gas vesicle synthesis-like protein [Streptomyces sparsogenes DSM 40356]